MSTGSSGGGRKGRGEKGAGADAPRPKPYRKPKLVVYGDIRAITQAVGMSGAMDGGNPPIHKSQL